MGIRSDVGIAVKKGVCFSEETTKFLESADDELTEKEGTLYVFESIKWYMDSYADIVKLYEELKGKDEGDYLIREACHDYPSDESGGNLGAWYDNPWGLNVCISTSLSY